MKECSKCKQVLPLEQFGIHNQGGNKLRAACKPCRAAYHAAWRRAHPEQVRASDKAYRQANLERNRKSSLGRILKHKYGISEYEYEIMVNKQRGNCALCGAQQPSAKRLSVDHDHKSGMVRQLLCQLCNIGLGMFKDDPTTLRAAAAYLEHHSERITA